jgi:hypothetical protein
MVCHAPIEVGSATVAAVGAVGTVGNSTFLVEFSKRCGNGGKTRFVFPRFPLARQFPQPGFGVAGSFPLRTSGHLVAFDGRGVGSLSASRCGAALFLSGFHAIAR